ncbi:Alpha/Beta hydrolase protein [Diplogelasinospora grovesii]|uniref:Alpha/Beta hydrolase protein n=1 Tax=Diplogelasinospora grovesii TaxID=303347 RepID=A0AAN6S7D4_9PEZI|nr:Alpha/Beta hydrolase protein [Diplogelasinospora grovesii]
MAAIPFSTPPHPVASSANLRPFTISVPDAEIEKLKVLLKLSPIAPPNWENSRKDGYFGISREVLVELAKYWQGGYDWRKWESTFNSLPQYKITVFDDDSKPYNIHFLALFSTNPSAIPILFLHGWPGSILEFLPLFLKLRSRYASSGPASLPYHIIAPHFIGFGFSDPPPANRGFTHVDNARLMSKMMHALGFSEPGYVVQGGDLGAATALVVASIDPVCKLVHVNLLNIPPPPDVDVEADIRAGKYTPDEVASLMSAKEFDKRGTAFIKLDGTRPSTAGFVIGSSPVGLLAWIGEKMIGWSDETPETDLILTNVSLYWFSGCYPTSIYLHRLIVDDYGALTHGWKTVNVPLGYSWFKKEISSPPKTWIDHTGKVSWYRKHDKGGHFAALELPEVLWEDVEDFVKEFW